MSLVRSLNLYLTLSPKRKKIILFLFWHFQTYKKIFPKAENIMKYAGCSHQCLKNLYQLNLEMGNIFFKVTKRYDSSGRQTTNLFTFDSEFLKALIWLDCHDFLRTPKSRYHMIRSRIENEEKVAPPSPQKLPPILEIKKRFKNTPLNPLKKEYIHHKIAKVKIPEKDQIMLSRYPEAWIEWGLENTLYAYRKGCKIENPTAFLWANIRIAEKRIRK